MVRLDTCSIGEIVHELSICEHILSVAVQAAERAGAKNITRVRVKHGELRAIVPDIMAHYFEFLAKDTIAAGAKLEMEVTKARAKCKSCGEEYPVQGFEFKCPACEKEEPELITGMELFLEDIEVQD